MPRDTLPVLAQTASGVIHLSFDGETLACNKAFAYELTTRPLPMIQDSPNRITCKTCQTTAHRVAHKIHLAIS
jgi:hypothetical protein